MATEVEYLIVGAGPAGLQLAYYLQKAGRDYLVLEAGDRPGAFFKTFPRHRTLISINKVYTGYDDPETNLRWDWNSLLSDSEDLLLKRYTGRFFPHADDLVTYLADFAIHHGIKVRYGTRVARISGGARFRVRDTQGNAYSAARLIIATGVSQPYVPAIPGLELAERYIDVSVDPQDFVNQLVLIIGKGNSAFETADNLVETAAVIHLASPHPITMAWKSHFVGHLRAVNNNVLDTYRLKSQNAVLDATITSIEQAGNRLKVHVAYTHASGEEEDLYYDRVILCTGFRFDSSIFDTGCRPALTINDRFPLQTSAWESVNVPDLYFAGTLTQMRDFKKTASGFIHGFRYNVRALHRLMEERHHGIAWPHTLVPTSPEALTNAVLDRINRSSGLWQQFGFLCDILVTTDDTSAYYEEVPVDYVQDSPFGRAAHYYTVTLEYGKEDEGDPFNVQRVHKDDAANGERSSFLHPVVRRYAGPVLLEEHHVIEDLAAEWLEDVHVQPLLAFFQRHLAAVPQPVLA